MYTQTVTPAGTRQETGYVLLAMLIVGLGFSVMVVHRTRPEKSTRLTDFQISAYHDLNSVEQGIFSDLYTAVFEIDGMHNADEVWPQIDELEQMYLAPFIRDAAWERRGKLTWTVKQVNQEFMHTAAYIGKTSASDVSGSFLILFSHAQEGNQAEQDETHTENHTHMSNLISIWYAAGDSPVVPEDLSVYSLIEHDWKAVVPYKGEEEIQRLKGGVM